MEEWRNLESYFIDVLSVVFYKQVDFKWHIIYLMAVWTWPLIARFVDGKILILIDLKSCIEVYVGDFAESQLLLILLNVGTWHYHYDNFM